MLFLLFCFLLFPTFLLFFSSLFCSDLNLHGKWLEFLFTCTHNHFVFISLNLSFRLLPTFIFFSSVSRHWNEASKRATTKMRNEKKKRNHIWENLFRSQISSNNLWYGPQERKRRRRRRQRLPMLLILCDCYCFVLDSSQFLGCNFPFGADFPFIGFYFIEHHWLTVLDIGEWTRTVNAKATMTTTTTVMTIA